MFPTSYRRYLSFLGSLDNIVTFKKIQNKNRAFEMSINLNSNLTLGPILAKSDCLCLEAFLRPSYEYSHLTKIGLVQGLS